MILKIIACPVCKEKITEDLHCYNCQKKFMKKEGVYIMLTDASEKEFRWDKKILEKDYEEINRKYDSYLDEDNLRAKEQAEKIFKKILSENLSGVTLDIATGRGMLLREILEMDIEQIIASDVDPNILLYDRRTLLNQLDKMVITLATDAKRLAIQTESIDYVVTLAGLNNIPNPVQAYKEIYRVLKKNGKLIALNIFVEEDSETFEQVKKLHYERALSKKLTEVDLKLAGFKVDIQIISKVSWIQHPMDGFPLAGDMKYYAIIIAEK